MTSEPLARVPLFVGLSAQELSEVHQLGVRRKFDAGTVLFVEDMPATTIFVVLSGRVRVSRQGAEGQRVVLHFVEAGEVLGCAILGGATHYPGTAELLEGGVVLAFDERGMDRLVGRFPVVARNALRMLSGRMEDLRVRLRELATERVEQRLAGMLLRLTEREEEIRISRQELAELVGATQFTVSRLLSAWERAGWVGLGRQRVRVQDRVGLAGV